MKPRIVQIVVVEKDDDRGTIFYGLAADGAVWAANPEYELPAESMWYGPVVRAPGAK